MALKLVCEQQNVDLGMCEWIRKPDVKNFVSKFKGGGCYQNYKSPSLVLRECESEDG